MEEIEKLDIDLLDEPDEIDRQYTKAKADYVYDKINNWSYSKDKAEASWDKLYPKGQTDWEKTNGHRHLTSFGQQEVVDRVNECIEAINQMKPIIEFIEKLKSEADRDDFLKNLKS